jgi:hypothetical protein
MLTPYQIADLAENYDGKTSRMIINNEFRKQDESHLWPVNNQFNVTERAIRRLRRLESQGLCIDDGLEYALSLDAEISRIVNSIN